jgi:hypothetical protein
MLLLSSNSPKHDDILHCAGGHVKKNECFVKISRVRPSGAYTGVRGAETYKKKAGLEVRPSLSAL